MPFVAGTTGQLAFLNNINDPWTAYTPTLSGITLGNGTLSGRYKQIGKTVYFSISLTLGSTSSITATGPLFGLPVAAVAGRRQAAAVEYYDSSATSLVWGLSEIASSTTAPYGPPTTAGSYWPLLSSTFPFAFATGDIISINGVYEAV